MGTDKGKVTATKDWFQQQFTDQQDYPLQLFEGTQRPSLKTHITEEEVKTATIALQNGHAEGTNGINSELFKNSKHIVSLPLAKIINSPFEHHVPIETLGGTLITLPKPKKSHGPPTNLQPIVLMNSIRTFLSIVTLRHTRNKIDPN